jgi:hypothetical protein
VAARLEGMASQDSLREWIRRHEVCFEVSPHYEVHEHRQVQVGFDLGLLAVLAGRPDPGAAVAVDVYERLRELAQMVLPEGARYEIEPFDGAFHLRRETDFEPEVQMVIEVLHPHGTFDCPDEADRNCLKSMVDALKRLGVQERVWRAMRGGA